ncbi:MAG: DNA-directed RNA polymerase [Candidatus Aenigmatarchaeota archaeon]
MYKILEVKDNVRVDPEKLGLDLEEAVSNSLEEKYEGTLDPKIGVILSIEDITEVKEGRILPEDGAAYYPVEFEMLVFEPQEHEVLPGEVVDITEFGAFIRIGPMDGLIHVSQVMDDYVNYDEKHGSLTGKESNRKLKTGDVVRTRIISISYSEENKVGLTMRQPNLGALHWLEEEEEEEDGEEEEE